LVKEVDLQLWSIIADFSAGFIRNESTPSIQLLNPRIVFAPRSSFGGE
jgi:hypothetical protein